MLFTQTLPQELSESLDQLAAAKAAIPPAFELAAGIHRAVSEARAIEGTSLYALSRARARLRQAEAAFIEGREGMAAVDAADAAVRVGMEEATRASDAVARAANLLAAAEARLEKLRGEHWAAVRVVMRLAEEHFTAAAPPWRVKPDALMCRGEALALALHLIRQTANAQGVPLLRCFLSGESFRAVVRRAFYFSPSTFAEGDVLDIPKDLPMVDGVREIHNGRLALVTE